MVFNLKTDNIDEAYYRNDPFNFDEVVVEHDTHFSVFNPQKHTFKDAQQTEDIHRPLHPAREVQEMHEYSEEAKQTIRIFQKLEPLFPLSEEEYLERFRSVAPEVFSGMEQNHKQKIQSDF
jgi:hypothetical protein